MNIHLFDTQLTLVYNKIKKLMQKKNKDYSSAEDIHTNFKRVAQLGNIYNVDVKEPQGVMRFFILIKFDRYMNLTSRGEAPQNESLEDTTIDSHVYQMLLNSFIRWEQYVEK